MKNRKQRAQLDNNCGTTKAAIAGVPEGFIDGPLLFNLFINDLVLFLTEIMLSNYANDYNLLSIGKDIDKIKAIPAKDFGTVTYWFHENLIVLNSIKCHLMCIGKNVMCIGKKEKKTKHIHLKMCVMKTARKKLSWE